MKFSDKSSRSWCTASIMAVVAGAAASSVTLPAYGIGVGVATANSYIGEPLAVRVPLFNVEQPESITVKLKQADGSVAILDAQIDRSNSQLGVVIRSVGRVNEPYLNFTLDLSDAGSVFSKEFTVLLNLSPEAPTSTGVGVYNTPSDISARPLTGSSRVSGDVQGPYEWAEPGRVAEKFGAVLDGQSLWRVARRINKGLGVSINQMMLSLYQQNPDAFSSSSIDSLKAGSFLTIPSYQLASQLSDSDAKVKLDQLSHNSSLVSSENAQSSLVSEPQRPAQPVLANADETQPQFQLSALDQVPSSDGSVGGKGDEKAQEIISSLAETVGNLTQELIRKDKQIAFLEEKVEALAAYAQVDADGLVLDASSADEELGVDIATDLAVVGSSLDSAEPVESLEQPSNTDSQLGGSELTESELIESNSVEEVVAEVEASAAETQVSSLEVSESPINKSQSVWTWVLLGLGALCLLAVMFRRRLLALFSSLNLFGRDTDLTFEQSVFEGTKSAVNSSVPIRTTETKKDYSVMSALTKPVDEDEPIEGVSYLSVDEQGGYEEMSSQSFNDSDLELVDGEDMSFSERFERLIADKDYDFARELLDFARYNEINDERYHCERLRLFQAMSDEDGFYEYYYEIESKIPSFAPNLQTQISQLVVELAQH